MCVQNILPIDRASIALVDPFWKFIFSLNRAKIWFNSKFNSNKIWNTHSKKVFIQMSSERSIELFIHKNWGNLFNIPNWGQNTYFLLDTQKAGIGSGGSGLNTLKWYVSICNCIQKFVCRKRLWLWLCESQSGTNEVQRLKRLTAVKFNYLLWVERFNNNFKLEDQLSF